MSVNTAVEGRRYRMPGTHIVTEAEIAAFCAAVRAPTAQQGPGVRPAPPTFAVTIAQRAEAEFMRDPDAGVDYARLVHGEESLTHHTPIAAGDAVQAETTVTRVRVVGGNSMVTLTTDVTTADGQPRATTTSLVVIRGEEQA